MPGFSLFRDFAVFGTGPENGIMVPGKGGSGMGIFDDRIQEVLFDEAAVAGKVRELGARITRDYAGRERGLVVVSILRGALVFTADLIRQIDLDLKLDTMVVSSYGQTTRSSGVVRINKDLEEDIAGCDVLLVEDIVDTGLTLSYLKNTLAARGPASIRTCVLLDKPDRREVELEIDYLGFTIPDAFVVGYGLDYSQEYRNYPGVAVLRAEVYEK